MKKILLLAVMLAGLMYIPSGAINLEQSKFDLEVQSLQASGSGFITSYTGSDKKGAGDNTLEETKGSSDYQYKSPKRAFVYSLIIPGWGQKYAGSTVIKPLAFLAVDIGMWALYFKYHKDGNDKTTEFQAYADKYWFETDTTPAGHSYRDWLTANNLSEDSLTHQLPDTKIQQYYEMIGKYDQFRGGWDDYWTDTTVYNTPHREYYNTMRGKANDLLDKAKSFIVFSMVNHIVSAFDAALAAGRHNRSQSGDNWLSLKTEMKYYSATEKIPVVQLSCKF